ncbi:MAG: PQQ-dependent sugar dehydrogenase, partial [Hyphomicrobiaceae bacterium]|nr:PQQ-dependent sugar dehydrogenase [Hyphomicrobiaceae bacterium]
MPRKTTLPALAVVLAAIAGPAAAECTLVATPVTQGLARPWGIGVLGDGRVLVTERGGRLSLIDLASGERLSVTGTPTVYAQGQGGLLDIAPAIDFADSARVYFTFSEIRGVGLAGTALATATLGGTESRPMLVDVEIIFRQSNPTASDYHFGSRVVPAPDGTLFVTIGDRGEAERAQDPEDHAGSVLHLNA